MEVQGSTASLNAFERRVVKRLLADGETNQDIQAKINLGRPKTVNFSRIDSVKKNHMQVSATDDELAQFSTFKKAFDARTGLNPYVDERLVKSREAMKFALGAFNNPSVTFRAEVFSVMANIAWTYLVLEYCHRNALPTARKNGHAISLSDFLKMKECPLSKGVVNNLRALVKIRDGVEHTLTGPSHSSWVGIFQACCVNYEKTMTDFFGSELSLVGESGFALQLASLSIGQALPMSQVEGQPEVQAINAEIFNDLSADELDDLEFSFSVVYTTVNSSKTDAAFKFLSPASVEGQEIANVLVKMKPGHETHPHKPAEVVSKVKKITGQKFNVSMHTALWKKHGVRPDGGVPDPQKDVNPKYCYYNPVWGSYSYNDDWVELVCNELT
jgi:hypothetical protein